MSALRDKFRLKGRCTFKKYSIHSSPKTIIEFTTIATKIFFKKYHQNYCKKFTPII
nr:MAG TPA_asm: hypothetical protein [Caudoviricetes sp.]